MIRAAAHRLFGTLLDPALALLAQDLTPQLVGRRVLVCTPHPDDETLACGAAISLATAGGGRVVIVCVTDGRHGVDGHDPETLAATRHDELLEASSVLGVPPCDVVTLGFEDASLALHPPREIDEALSPLLDKHQPDLVFAPSPFDLHSDHAVVGASTRRLLAGRAARHFEYFVWARLRPLAVVKQARAAGAPSALGKPTKVRTAGVAARKAAALACYRSQIEPSGPLADDLLRHFRKGTELFFEAPRRLRGT